MSGSTNQAIKFAPVRSISDFLLDSTKYLPPTFNNLRRLNNRVSSNLLYYQTNYFLVSIIVFGLFSLFGFRKMLLGVFGITTTGAVILFTLNIIPPKISYLKAKYPIAVFGLGAFNLLVIYWTIRPILFFALALLIPIAFWIIHASIRSRGLKNRISNKMEKIGASVYANSPMGFILTTFGLETKDFEE